MQEASLFARSLTVQVLLSHLSMECVKYSLLWSEWSKARQLPFLYFRFAKVKLKCYPQCCLLPQCFWYAAVNHCQRPKESCTPKHIWSPGFTNSISCFYAAAPKNRWWFWFLPQPSKSSSSLRKVGCSVWRNENVFYSKTLMSFFSNQEAKQRSTGEQCCF